MKFGRQKGGVEAYGDSAFLFGRVENSMDNNLLNKTPKSEIHLRIEKLKNLMMKSGMEAALVVQNTDLFYFAGTVQQSWLFVPSGGEPVLLARKDSKRASAESPLDRVDFLSSSKELPGALKEFGYAIPEKLGMELDVLPVNLFRGYRKIFENTEIVDISPLIRNARAVKSEYEIGKTRTAARLADEVFATVKDHLKEGMTEVAFAGRIEAEARERGHQGIVRMRMWGGELFYGHIMTGASAAVPSFLASPTGGAGVSAATAQGAGFKRIVANEPVLVDYVFAHDGYLSDQARIFCLGKVSPELQKAHRLMLELQDRLKKATAPGSIGDEIYEECLEFTKSRGVYDYFMGVGNQRIKFVGHGVGLELDEYPFIAKGQRLPLEEGMTLALEPKLVFPGKGVVGIENTHVVTRTGLEQLGKFEEEIVSF